MHAVRTGMNEMMATAVSRSRNDGNERTARAIHGILDTRVPVLQYGARARARAEVVLVRTGWARAAAMPTTMQAR
eukprot:COSAG02_NODE_3875_length_6104_cov_4.803331_8_plen_75_part_00